MIMTEHDSATIMARLGDLIEDLLRCGADEAEAVYLDSVQASFTARMRRSEHAEWSRSSAIGLRVLINQREACVSGDGLNDDTIKQLKERVIAMAKVLPQDPYAGLALPEQLYRATTPPDLELFDPATPTPEQLIEQAGQCEEAALEHDLIVNSEGATASHSQSHEWHLASNGLQCEHQSSSHSLGVYVIAGDDRGMEGDYEFANRVFMADLPDGRAIGQKAAEQALRRLGARKTSTATVPVMFHPRVAASLLGHFANAINGAAIARGTSFLKDKMGEAIFSSQIRITDDPLIKRGHGSRLFDSDGIESRPVDLIADGVLQSWMLDLRTARQLDLAPTGHACRSLMASGSPGRSNLYLAPGPDSVQSMLAGVKQGFYCTDLMGMGVNLVTGDYSRGASGFWIEQGELAWPAHEVTIAGNLLDMFANLQPADDLAFHYVTNAPHILIAKMSVAGL
ncbi:MAG: TldD/PmbA family protein [Pseudomonadota bacterium]